MLTVKSKFPFRLLWTHCTRGDKMSDWTVKVVRIPLVPVGCEQDTAVNVCLIAHTMTHGQRNIQEYRFLPYYAEYLAKMIMHKKLFPPFDLDKGRYPLINFMGAKTDMDKDFYRSQK